MRASKADLVDRLLVAEQAYAEMEDRWRRTADDLLVWIMPVDRIIALPSDSRVEPLRSTTPWRSTRAVEGPAGIGTKQYVKAPISDALSTGVRSAVSNCSIWRVTAPFNHLSDTTFAPARRREFPAAWG